MPLFDHFEWLSPYYDRIFKRDKPEPIIRLAALPTDGIVLDAGGGTGRISEQILDLAGSVVIADYSLGMLKQASRKNGLNTVCAQTEKLPFANKSFDRVIMVDALHHVFDQQKTLEELWRVVKPGGRVLIEEPDVRNFLIKLLAIGEKLLLMRSRLINPTRIAKMCRFDDVMISIENDGYISWVILEKRL